MLLPKRNSLTTQQDATSARRLNLPTSYENDTQSNARRLVTERAERESRATAKPYVIGAGKVMNSMGAPQRKMMKAATGSEQTPGEYLVNKGYLNPDAGGLKGLLGSAGKFAADTVIDPANLVGAGIAGKIAGKAKLVGKMADAGVNYEKLLANLPRRELQSSAATSARQEAQSFLRESYAAHEVPATYNTPAFQPKPQLNPNYRAEPQLMTFEQVQARRAERRVRQQTASKPAPVPASQPVAPRSAATASVPPPPPITNSLFPAELTSEQLAGKKAGLNTLWGIENEHPLIRKMAMQRGRYVNQDFSHFNFERSNGTWQFDEAASDASATLRDSRDNTSYISPPPFRDTQSGLPSLLSVATGKPDKTVAETLAELGIDKKDADKFAKVHKPGDPMTGSLDYSNTGTPTQHFIKDRTSLVATNELDDHLATFGRMRDQVSALNPQHPMVESINRTLEDLHSTKWLRNDHLAELRGRGLNPDMNDLSVVSGTYGTKYLINGTDGRLMGNISGINPKDPFVSTAALAREYHGDMAAGKQNGLGQALYRGIAKGIREVHGKNLSTGEHFAATDFVNPATGLMETRKRAKDFWDNNIKHGNAQRRADGRGIEMIRSLLLPGAGAVGAGALGVGSQRNAKGGLLPGKLTMLGPDGKAQMELGGGNRIFSRKDTRELVSRSLKAKTPAELREHPADARPAGPQQIGVHDGVTADCW